VEIPFQHLGRFVTSFCFLFCFLACFLFCFLAYVSHNSKYLFRPNVSQKMIKEKRRVSGPLQPPCSTVLSTPNSMLYSRRSCRAVVVKPEISYSPPSLRALELVQKYSSRAPEPWSRRISPTLPSAIVLHRR